MTVPDNLDEILERVRTRTSTDEDLEVLEQLHSKNGTVQNVTQSGKYSVNVGQGTLNIGDHNGPSVEDIQTIVRELQTLQLQDNRVATEQLEPFNEDEPLELPSIEPQIVELINSRLSAIEELRKVVQISDTQQAELGTVKGKLRSLRLEEINQELQMLANEIDRILQEAVDALKAKLKELDNSSEENLLEARSRICLKQQIELLERFQADLNNGKVVARWLDRQRSQNIAQNLAQHALGIYPQVKESISALRVEAFQFSIEQFLERLSHCLTWGRTNILDNPTTPLVLDDEIYAVVFENFRSLIPDHLPSEGINQLQEYIDYLIQNLSNYSHITID